MRPRRENGSSPSTISLKISPKTAKAVAGSHDSPRKLVAGVFLLSATGEVLASSWKDIGLNFSAEGWSKFTSEGVFLKWEEKVGAKLDDNRLKLVLYDVSRDRVGSRVAKIR